jgi:hypothetical protein
MRQLLSICVTLLGLFSSVYAFGHHKLPLRTHSKNVNGNIIKISEPIHCPSSDIKNASCVCLFTGANSIIPSDIYSDFIQELTSQNIATYVLTSDLETSKIVIGDNLEKYENVTLVGHSTGCVNALKMCNEFSKIKKLVLMDPVDNRILERATKFNPMDKMMDMLVQNILVRLVSNQGYLNFEKSDDGEETGDNFVLKNIEKVLIINAAKSYEWKLFPLTIPFIPAFGVKKDKLVSYNNNFEVSLLQANEFGHTDILNPLWSNFMHNTISKGHNKRDLHILSEYQLWLAQVISSFSEGTYKEHEYEFKKKIDKL